MKAIDTSVLYALFNATDEHHAAARQAVLSHYPIYVPGCVLQETLDLLRFRHGRQVASNALAWLKSTPQFALGGSALEQSYTRAQNLFLDLSDTLSPHLATARGRATFADVWCITQAAALAIPLLTSDIHQAAVAHEQGVATIHIP